MYGGIIRRGVGNPDKILKFEGEGGGWWKFEVDGSIEDIPKLCVRECALASLRVWAGGWGEGWQYIEGRWGWLKDIIFFFEKTMSMPAPE